MLTEIVVLSEAQPLELILYRRGAAKHARSHLDQTSVVECLFERVGVTVDVMQRGRPASEMASQLGRPSRPKGGRSIWLETESGADVGEGPPAWPRAATQPVFLSEVEPSNVDPTHQLSEMQATLSDG